MTARSRSVTKTSAKEPEPETLGVNVAALMGHLSSDPVTRELASGTTVVNYEVTCRTDPHGKESVPVCWVDPPRRSGLLRKGDEVLVVGRVRRRFFRSGGATASRTEVVAESVAKVSANTSVKLEKFLAKSTNGRTMTTD